MKVAEAVQQMSKTYLHRIIESFARDFPKAEEDRSREIIIKNTDELTDPERIKRRLTFSEVPYDVQILESCILTAILNQPDRKMRESDIFKDVSQIQKSVIEEASGSDGLKYEDEKAVEILRTVLEVAVEDEEISQDELGLIRRLREKLGISEHSQRIILAQLDHFPRAGNELHSHGDFRDALNDLQKRGVLFYCNRLDDSQYVIPEEVIPGVKNALGVELSDKSWQLLLDRLSRTQLKKILDYRQLPVSGVKDAQISRVIASGLSPSEALDVLSNQELYDICKRLPGANVSGTKADKIARVVDYFANLVTKDIRKEAEPGERYYQYFSELAARDRENLLGNKVIKKDRDMDGAFEEATRFLFTRKLGLELVDTEGTDHPDGIVEFSKGGDLLMWDNKSKESVYGLPQSHVRQFKRYIRDSDRRVSCFLVIAPEIDPSAEKGAARLKAESKRDTDVALITAEDLKWVAENWQSHSSEKRFDLEVFNVTGVLSRTTLQQRMKLFL